MDLLFPIDRDMEMDEKTEKQTFQPDPRQYTMQPTKDGAIGENKLFFSLFHPSRFKYLNEWPENATTWYLKFFVHFVSLKDEETGRTRRIPVVCEPSFNKYARERLTQPQMVFPEPFPEVTTCEFCEKSQEYWDQFREAKTASGIEGLSIDDYRKIMRDNPQISRLKEQAMQWAPVERVYFAVFDYLKYIGDKRVEGDDSVVFQGYWGGPKILADLFKEYKGGFKFYDPKGNNPIVKIERNNSGKGGARFCTYDVRATNEPADFSEEVLNYLLAMDDVPDPFNTVEIWEPGQKLAYVNHVPTNGTEETIESSTTVVSTPTPQVAVSPPKPRVTPRVKVTPPTPTSAAVGQNPTPDTSSPRRPKVELTFRNKTFTP